MTCITAERLGVRLAVSCPPSTLSTAGFHGCANPAPLGLKRLDVKSARSSLEWTTPKVPKPLIENIRVAASSVLATTPAGDHSIATRTTAFRGWDEAYCLDRVA